LTKENFKSLPPLCTDGAWGTELQKLDPKDIRYGLDRYYDNEKDEDFGALMKRPFQKLHD
jgi:hypothetical protein